MSGHAGYVLAAYGAAALVVAGLLGALLLRRRRLERALARFGRAADEA